MEPNYEPDKRVTDKVDELFLQFTMIELTQLIALMAAGIANFLITAKHKNNGKKESVQ